MRKQNTIVGGLLIFITILSIISPASAAPSVAAKSGDIIVYKTVITSVDPSYIKYEVELVETSTTTTITCKSYTSSYETGPWTVSSDTTIKVTGDIDTDAGAIFIEQGSTFEDYTCTSCEVIAGGYGIQFTEADAVNKIIYSTTGVLLSIEITGDLVEGKMEIVSSLSTIEGADQDPKDPTGMNTYLYVGIGVGVGVVVIVIVVVMKKRKKSDSKTDSSVSIGTSYLPFNNPDEANPQPTYSAPPPPNYSPDPEEYKPPKSKYALDF
jgi:hypothetical protein